MTAFVTDPAHGTLDANADGSFRYTPNAGFIGTDTFTYRANNGTFVGFSNVATVTFDVTPNHTPIAVDDRFSIDQDTTLAISAPGLLADDSDPDGTPLAISMVIASSLHGTLTANNPDGSFAYVPPASFSGTDTFQYRITDGIAESGFATVTITVIPVDNPPVLVADAYSVEKGTTLTVDAAHGLLVNDTDADGDALTVTATGIPSHGTLDFAPDGSFAYTTNPAFRGTDTFSYDLSDGNFIEEGNVTINVTDAAANQPPVANAVSDGSATSKRATVAIDVPQHGDVTLAGDGSFLYAPNPDFAGTDGFGYAISDGIANDLGSVTITIVANTPPIAGDDAFTIAQESVLTVAAPGLLTNDGDADGNPIRVSDNTKPSHGTLTGPFDDGSFTYTPFAGFIGTDRFAYAVFDGSEDSDVATVMITVEPADEDSPTPTATPDPTEEPSETPAPEPTPTGESDPAEEPTQTPTATATEEPTEAPPDTPPTNPTEEPTQKPTTPPTATPTTEPTDDPTDEPTETPDADPSATEPQPGDDDPLVDGVSETPGGRVDQTNVATPPDTGTGSQRKQPTDYLPFLLVALGLAGSGLAVRRGSKAT